MSEGFRTDSAKAAEDRNKMLNLEGDSPKMREYNEDGEKILFFKESFSTLI